MFVILETEVYLRVGVYSGVACIFCGVHTKDQFNKAPKA